MKKATTDKDIIIRPADKGGRWVILDSRLYRSECLQQLCDDSFYAAIQEHSTPQHSRVTDILLDLHRRGFLSRKELRFLLPPESPRTRRFYILPKVHKLLRPNGAPPGRPIVSDVGSATYHVGKLVDFFLGPLAQRLQSSDSYELIAKLSCVSINSNTVFCTLDVRSLYTNIPIEEGLRRVRRAFARYPSTDRPNKEILELLRLSLTTNDFQFEDSSWLQISGVAMGKAFGGAFANIYMGDWETEVLSSVATVPSTWYRYQDDIFFLWDHPVDLLDRFLASINAVDPHIQVDLTFNKDVISFLDLQLFRDANEIGYRVWFKPTDSHFLLPPSSHHPSHTIRGVIYSQIRRWATHCKIREDFSKACTTILPLWRGQGISRSAIRTARFKVLYNLGKITSWTPGFFKCGGRRCSACEAADERSTFCAGGRTYPIVHRLSCDSHECIYVLACTRCHVFYIGQTGNSIRQRFSEHLRSFRNPSRSTHLISHFTRSCSPTSIRVFGIERCEDRDKRLAKEARWIARFNSVAPGGLNVLSSSASRPINLVTSLAQCTRKLSSTIKKVCENVTDLKVQISYRRDRNLRNILG